MRVQIDPSAFRRTKWSEYAIRFVSGGLITVAAGIIANKFGPSLGGVFLAFPAIFPASATLIEKHESKKKDEKGLHGTKRGSKAASVDAAGAAMGSVGLFVFALMVWQLIPGHSHWLILVTATLTWLVVAMLSWHIRKRHNALQ